MANPNQILSKADFTEDEIKKHPFLFSPDYGSSFGLSPEDDPLHRENIEFMRQQNLRKIIYLRNKQQKKAENKKKTGREYCVFCFNACKPSRKYLSHTRLSECATLKHTKCGKCGELGHTRKKCRSLEDKNIRVRRRVNMRPDDEYDSDCGYCDGDSENWTDSSDEEDSMVFLKETVTVAEPSVALVEPIVVAKKVTTWASIAAKNINK